MPRKTRTCGVYCFRNLAYPSRQKSIVQIDPANGIVAFFSSITLARITTGANNIGQVCSGKWETSKGFIWQYA